MNRSLIKHSKFLSLILRHKPEIVGLHLDEYGWVAVSDLLKALDSNGHSISFELLEQIVQTNDKQRFAFNEDKTKIRANQGHSVSRVDLQLQEIQPPDTLYHGTVEKFMTSIEESGLQKMNRQHVHLSETLKTAMDIGGRRGKPVILHVRSGAMYRDGFKFYRSKNGVWLTDSVPLEYLNPVTH